MAENSPKSVMKEDSAWQEQERQQILERVRGTTYQQRIEWLESAIGFVKKYKGIARPKNSKP